MSVLKRQPLWSRLFWSALPLEIAVIVGSAALAIASKLPAPASTSTTLQTLISFPPQNPWTTGLIVVVGVCGVLKSIYSWRTAKPSKVHAIEGLLHVLHSQLNFAGTNYDDLLRLSIFVPETNDSVRQLVNYVGKDRSGVDRVIPLAKGIVGRAVRVFQMEVANKTVNVSIHDYLAAEFGYTIEEARKMRSDRNAWIAVPMGKPSDVTCVLYADSSIRGFFGPANSPRRRLLTNALPGIHEFVHNS